MMQSKAWHRVTVLCTILEDNRYFELELYVKAFKGFKVISLNLAEPKSNLNPNPNTNPGPKLNPNLILTLTLTITLTLNIFIRKPGLALSPRWGLPHFQPQHWFEGWSRRFRSLQDNHRAITRQDKTRDKRQATRRSKARDKARQGILQRQAKRKCETGRETRQRKKNKTCTFFPRHPGVTHRGTMIDHTLYPTQTLR